MSNDMGRLQRIGRIMDDLDALTRDLNEEERLLRSLPKQSHRAGRQANVARRLILVMEELLKAEINEDSMEIYRCEI